MSSKRNLRNKKSKKSRKLYIKKSLTGGVNSLPNNKSIISSIIESFSLPKNYKVNSEPSTLLVPPFSIQFLIGIVLHKNPEIIELLNTISNNPEDFQKKMKYFINNKTIKLTEVEIVYIGLICALCYNNDIMPTFVYNVLNKIDPTLKVGLSEIKKNTAAFVNIFLGKPNNQLGGGFLDIMKNIAIIGYVVIVGFVDYKFITNPAFEDDYSIFLDIKDTAYVISGNKVCDNITTPPLVKYIGKWGDVKDNSEFVDKLYKTMACVGNELYYENVYEHMVESQKFEFDINKNFTPDDEPNFKESKEVALYEGPERIDSNAIALYEKSPEFSEFYENSVSVLRSELPKTYTSKEDIDKGIAVLDKYLSMPASDFKELFKKEKSTTPIDESDIQIEVEEYVNTEGPTFFGNILNRMKKTSNFFYETANVVKELTNDLNVVLGGTIHTINPIDSYFWMLKMAMKHTKRNFVLQQQNIEWRVEDYIDNMNKLQLDFFGFIRAIKILLPFNISAMGIILMFVRKMILRLLQKNKKYSAIANGNENLPELTDGTLDESNRLTYTPTSERRLTRRSPKGGRLTQKIPIKYM